MVQKNTTTTTVDEDSKPIPKNFTISNQDNKLINVSMDKEIDEFIDIQTKPLSYAEVAQFGKYKNNQFQNHLHLHHLLIQNLKIFQIL